MQEIAHEPSDLVCCVFYREVPGIEGVIFGCRVIDLDGDEAGVGRDDVPWLYLVMTRAPATVYGSAATMASASSSVSSS